MDGRTEWHWEGRDSGLVNLTSDPLIRLSPDEVGPWLKVLLETDFEFSSIFG